MTRADRGLWVGVALGVPVMAVGLVAVLAETADTRPAELARWMVGGVIAVDLVVLPVALVAGRGLHARPIARGALAAAATVVLVAWPFIRGYGLSAGNPSLLPRDYATGTAVAVAAIALAALPLGARRRRRRTPTGS